MKSLISFIGLCVPGMFFIACEKAEIQQSTSSTVPIEERSCPIDDCDDCPVDDCCCSITLLSDPSPNQVDLQLCGTSGLCPSTTPCSAGSLGMCSDINGDVEFITLPNQFSTAMFCAAKNAPFGIISSNGAHTVRITCQVGQANPQTVTIQLNTAPDKPYWETNGSCELTACF